MKATRFLDLAAASRSLFFAGATRALIILGLLLLPMFVSSSFDLGSGSTAMAGPPDGKGSGKGDLYSDLMVTYRTVDGLPIFVGVPAGIEVKRDSPGLEPLQDHGKANFLSVL